VDVWRAYVFREVKRRSGLVRLCLANLGCVFGQRVDDGQIKLCEGAGSGAGRRVQNGSSGVACRRGMGARAESRQRRAYCFGNCFSRSFCVFWTCANEQGNSDLIR